MVKNLLSEKMQKAITVQNLIKKGVPTRDIMKQCGVNKQYISYWRHKEIKETHYRKKKLPTKYIKWLVEIASNRPVSECSSRNMARVLNKKLKKEKITDSKKRQLTIGYRTINKILNKFIGEPRKIRKVFFLSEDQKRKRIDFCKKILEKGLTGKEIFFTDETQIDLSNYVNDSIRLTKENEEKLKKGELDVYDLITRPKKKFEKSIMVAGVYLTTG